MSSYRYRPSKPVAVLGAVFGAAFVVFGMVRMLDGGAAEDGGGVAFLVLWCVAGVAIIGLNLRAAFSTRGAPGSLVRDEDADRSR